MDLIFSIIIPTYNRAHIILRAIESVKIQTFSNWELIIVDDGSTDHTEDTIRKIDDPRINYFKKNHAERSAARNFGIAKAKGKYICFLDSDDYFLKDHYSGTKNYSKAGLISDEEVERFLIRSNELAYQGLVKPGRLPSPSAPGLLRRTS